MIFNSCKGNEIENVLKLAGTSGFKMTKTMKSSFHNQFKCLHLICLKNALSLSFPDFTFTTVFCRVWKKNLGKLGEAFTKLLTDQDNMPIS